MLMVSTSDPFEKIFLINSLYGLGVSYHIENKIEELLSHLFITLPKLLDDENVDLHITAVTFQVFRLHGYKIPCDVFSKFLDGDGKFKEALIGNIKGMISLYEASPFKTKGEFILDEALAFTTKHLGSLANQSSPHLRKYIENALFHAFDISAFDELPADVGKILFEIMIQVHDEVENQVPKERSYYFPYAKDAVQYLKRLS
ncbi:hypothetical protein PTKIN_Ptkin07bG0242300 [Pterospermum kingtungense]